MVKPEDLHEYGIFPGFDPRATPEEVAAELYRSIKRIKRGRFTVIADVDE